MPVLRRRRGHGAGAINRHANALLSWGANGPNALGNGFNGTYLPSAVGATAITKVLQVVASSGRLVLDDAGHIYTWGSNGYGAQGFATSPFLGQSVLVPTRIIGGIPLYLPESFNEKGIPFNQPEGPPGPLLPSIAAIAGGSGSRYALTGLGAGVNPRTGAPVAINKRVLAWGSNAAGSLGNGWEQGSESAQKNWESGIWKPQYAPDWVLTGAPAGEEAPGGSNVLEGVKAIAAARQVLICLMEDGRVFLNGSPATFSKAKNGGVYWATLDPAWDAYRLAHGSPLPLAVATNASNYCLIMPDHTLRVVGVVQSNNEGQFGDGTTGTTTTREVRTPEYEDSPGHFMPLDKVVAISSGQYFYLALKDDGTVWPWGSNRDGQLGLGLQYQDVPDGGWATVTRPTKLAALNDGGTRKVIAISAGGKGEEVGTGEKGGECAIALRDDKTARTWGKSYIQRDGTTLFGQGTGACGDGTTMTRNAPVVPILSTGIVGVEAGSTGMTVIQEPGTPALASLLATSPKAGEVRVEWREVDYPVGSLSHWRRAEGWRVKVTEGPGANSDSGPLAVGYGETAPGSGVHVYSVSGLTAGLYKVSVIETSVTEAPAITGGSTQTASAGKLLVAWADPVLPEPGWYVEWHRAPGLEKDVLKTTLTAAASAGDLAVYVLKTPGLSVGDQIKVGGTATPGTGEYVEIQHVDKVTHEVELKEPLTEAHAEGENVYEVKLTSDIFTRSALLAAGDRSYPLTLEPSAHGLTNENLTLKLHGSFEPSFKTRTVPIVVL